ncbi:hypothetical protein B9Z55_000583 [Caenorhabditis nigoni]|nr:hypothetical protein B9Z55_000583 [Caenorhabditis nigoni]
MALKLPKNKRKLFSDSDVKTEVTEAETPVRKKTKTNRQDSSSDTNTTIVAPLGAPLKYVDRNRYTSLWIAFPQADPSHLLEFVLGDELIERLPEYFELFLTDWLMSVQKNMTKMLESDDLRKTIKSMMIKCQESLVRSDERLNFFLLKILKTILETQTFVIFEEVSGWLNFIKKFVKNCSWEERIEEAVLMNVFNKVSKSSKEVLSSFFTGSIRHKSKEVKVYYCHILRFVLKFTFNTLRHVFKFDPENGHLFYDGELEENTTVYETPTPVTCDSTSGTISMDLISPIPFGVPLMYLKRNEYPSLWITLPRADHSQLLEFVLEDQLIDVTSEPLKQFLVDWLLSVQQQMIETLHNDGLRKTIESMNVNCKKSLRRGDKRIRMFLEQILRTVLDTPFFAIFEEEESTYFHFISSFVKNRKIKREIDETVLTKVFNSLSRSARHTVLSFFTGKNQKRKAAVYYYYILRFALKLALNTLRHVFKFRPKSCRFYYNGVLEEEEPTNQLIEWENFVEENDVQPPVNQYRTHVEYDSSSGTISIDPTTDIPFGVPSMYLERNEHPSLWMTMPRADQSELLAFVLEDKPRNVIPKRFKQFLTDWLLSVQQKMIETLQNDGLRKTIKSVKIRAHEYPSRRDDRIYFFLKEILETVFDTEGFVIFERGTRWLSFIKRFIKNGKLNKEIDETVLTSVFGTLSKKAIKAMSSFFNGSQEDKSKQVKVYYFHILRFVFILTFNTLRYAFKFDPKNSRFYYDGSLEEDELSNRQAEWEKVAEENDVKPQVNQYRTPVSYDSSSGTISKHPTTAVSFGAPAMHLESVTEEREVKHRVVRFAEPVYDVISTVPPPNVPSSLDTANWESFAEEHDVKPQLPLANPFGAPVAVARSHLLPKEVVPTVPPSNVPSSSNIEDKMSQYMQFFDSSLVPQKWLNAFKMVVQHNEYLKSQEAKLEARYRELKEEVREMKEEKKRRRMI